MSEKKNYQLKNEDMESYKLDIDKLEQVSGGKAKDTVQTIAINNRPDKSKFILDSKPEEDKETLSIRITD